MGFTLKLAIVTATVLSTAVLFKLLSPFITDFAIYDLPTIWTAVTSWLKPPYLYVVMNCIIITIVASSRLKTEKLDDSNSTPVLIPGEPVKAVPVEVLQLAHELEPVFHGCVLEDEPMKVAVSSYTSYSEPVRFITDGFIHEDMKIGEEANEEIKKHTVDKSATSVSRRTHPVDLSDRIEKPPVSARLGKRKSGKVTPEGNRTLEIATPKLHDTLETTWRTITEGRSTTFTRHLGKSDTWQSHDQSRNSQRMMRLETFAFAGDTSKKPLSPPPQSKLSLSSGTGQLRKEPSLEQEELNRRVEAFIKKFNENMRLQRQESLNKYIK